MLFICEKYSEHLCVQKKESFSNVFRGPNISPTLFYFFTWTGDQILKGANVNRIGGDSKCEELSGQCTFSLGKIVHSLLRSLEITNNSVVLFRIQWVQFLTGVNIRIGRKKLQLQKFKFVFVEDKITPSVLITQVFASLRFTNKFYFSNTPVNKEVALAQMATYVTAVLKGL